MNDRCFEIVKIKRKMPPAELELDWEYVEKVNEYIVDTDGGDLRVIPLDVHWFVLSRKLQCSGKRWYSRGDKGFTTPKDAQLYAERWAKKKGWI